jgi:2-haloacid dehalogenase
MGHSLVLFSVGPRAWPERLAGANGIAVDQIISAEDVRVYKPHPAIYQHLLRATASSTRSTLLISANPFDLIGGSATGLKTAWCRRNPRERFDPWGGPPDYTVASLDELIRLDLSAPGDEDLR